MSARRFARGRARPKRRGQRAVAELMPLRKALEHERYALTVVAFMRAARSSAHDPAGKLECCACSKPWTLQRRPSAILVIEPLAAGPMPPLVAGVCGDCARLPDARTRVVAAMHRDIRLDPRRTVILAEGGRA